MTLRFVAQVAATMPCAPGFTSGRAGSSGVLKIPTLFVDYHPANDMFFSGHAGTIVCAAIRSFGMGNTLSTVAHVVTQPFVATLVVAFRAHRGIADPLDRLLQVEYNGKKKEKQEKQEN